MLTFLVVGFLCIFLYSDLRGRLLLRDALLLATFPALALAAYQLLLWGVHFQVFVGVNLLGLQLDFPSLGLAGLGWVLAHRCAPWGEERARAFWERLA